MEKWKSDVFSIHHGTSIGHLQNAAGPDWEYPSVQLSQLIRPVPEADFTVGVINARLENNFYMHRLSSTVGVLSLFEMADILRQSDHTVEDYILRNVYELAVLYAASDGQIPEDAYTWAHDDVRGCLFDMNANKPDIVFSMHKPTLCEECRARVLAKQVDKDLFPALDGDCPGSGKHSIFGLRNG